MNTDYIHHVADEHNFEDAYLFFRFRQDGESPISVFPLSHSHISFYSTVIPYPTFPYPIPEPPEQAGPSVAYMKGQEGALISPLAKKRVVLGWTYYIFVLSAPNKKLYQYRTELV